MSNRNHSIALYPDLLPGAALRDTLPRDAKTIGGLLANSRYWGTALLRPFGHVEGDQEGLKLDESWTKMPGRYTPSRTNRTDITEFESGSMLYINRKGELIAAYAPAQPAWQPRTSYLPPRLLDAELLADYDLRAGLKPMDPEAAAFRSRQVAMALSNFAVVHRLVDKLRPGT